MAKSLRDLPEGMLMEILSRLPVKSLLSCKSVCKPWLSIISNPHFIKSQLHRSIISYYSHPTLLTILDPSLKPSEEEEVPLEHSVTAPYQRGQQLVNEALFGTNGQDLSVSPVNIIRLVMPPLFKSDFRVVSSQNGIICLANAVGNVVYLWNPTIMQCRKLPEPATYSNIFVPVPVEMGFGYESNSQYKVIRLVYEELFDVVPTVQVYSTGTDCWKEFKAPILQTWKDWSRAHVVVNGVLYFSGANELVSFDLHNEVFGLVPFPAFIREKRSDVLDFEGSVAMIFESGLGIDLWTLDVVSGHVSWTKSFIIENASETEIWLKFYLGAGQFYRSKIFDEAYSMYKVLYGYEKKEIKYYGLGEQYSHANLKYTESLVSRFEPVE